MVRSLLAKLGWSCVDFAPRVSCLGDWEAAFRRLPPVEAVWVPCFRQRDLVAAARYAKRKDIPLIFDPLISSYDKLVFERRKVEEHSVQAERLRQDEAALFALADVVVADTICHRRFFCESLEVPESKVHVVYVGAEEMFKPLPHQPNDVPEVLFYGSFIPLQGTQIIVEAAKLYQGPPVRWTLLGEGPLKSICEAAAKGCPNISFEPYVPYDQLPERISRADILLGVFGETPKAVRVIPNKVFQALACGRPVVTSASSAYPTTAAEATGLTFVQQADAGALVSAIARLAEKSTELPMLGKQARHYFDSYFSAAVVQQQLARVLQLAGV